MYLSIDFTILSRDGVVARCLDFYFNSIVACFTSKIFTSEHFWVVLNKLLMFMGIRYTSDHYCIAELCTVVSTICFNTISIQKNYIYTDILKNEMIHHLEWMPPQAELIYLLKKNIQVNYCHDHSYKIKCFFCFFIDAMVIFVFCSFVFIVVDTKVHPQCRQNSNFMII